MDSFEMDELRKRWEQLDAALKQLKRELEPIKNWRLKCP
jgi:hypothetical protein